MGGSTVLVVLAVALQVGVILGQAPFLTTENQCGALYDQKLFHVCTAGESLRSARAVTHADPFADAAINNAQTLLDRAALLLSGTPVATDAKHQAPVLGSAAKHDAKPSLVNQLKHAAQTLSVSSCILQNSVGVLNDAIRALEAARVQPLRQDAEATTEKPVPVPVAEAAAEEAPVVKDPEIPLAEPESLRPPERTPGAVDIATFINGKPVVEATTVEAPVVKDPVADPPRAVPERLRPSGRPSISVTAFVNGKPVAVIPQIEISQSSNSGPHEHGPPLPPRSPQHPQHPQPPQDPQDPEDPQDPQPPKHSANDPLPPVDPAAILSGMDKLNFLNGKVHTLSKQVADLLANLGASLAKPVRTQSFHKLTRAPLEEIQRIQVVLARSEGAEMEDEAEAEVVVRDLQRQQEQLKKLLDSPDELKEKLKQPKDRNVSQELVTELKALKKTLTLVLPLPQELY